MQYFMKICDDTNIMKELEYGVSNPLVIKIDPPLYVLLLYFNPNMAKIHKKHCPFTPFRLKGLCIRASREQNLQKLYVISLY